MIGETLRRERERQKLSLKDIEQGTSIRSAYIEAIETGEYDKLPGEVYAKGFIKNYANFLNLNSEALVKEFIREIAPPVVEAEDVSVKNSVIETVETPKVERVEKVRTKITELEEPNVKIRQNKGGSNSSILVIAAVVFIAVIAGGIWYSIQPQQGGEIVKADVHTEQTQKIVNEPDAIGTATQTPTMQNNSATPANNSAVNSVSAVTPQNVSVQARFTGDCWTRVTADGVVVYEGIANAGQVLDWNGKERVNVRVGNAGAVEITMNGQNVGHIGAMGQVVEKTFTR